MGERLSISFIHSGAEIANAFYLWGASTSSATTFTKEILDAYQMLKSQIADPVERCVRALHAGEAGFPDDEKALIEKACPHYLELANEFPMEEQQCGLIAVSPAGMAHNTSDVLSTVQIDIDRETVCMDAFVPIDEEFYEEEPEEQEMTSEEFSEFMEENTIDLGDMNLGQMRFSDFARFAEALFSRRVGDDYFFKVNGEFVCHTY